MARRKALVVIPTFVREEGDVEITVKAVASVRRTIGDGVDVLLVDDGSPEEDLVLQMAEEVEKKHQAETEIKEENEGFSKTVNVGLRRARDTGRDAILMNADVEITSKHWLRHFRNTKDEVGDPAAVVGALLVFPNGLIQHAGIYFSLLTRTFDHRYKYGPQNLEEALEITVCPVTAALQFIRHHTLETVGLYDEEFLMGWEDVDYCIRTFLAKGQCIYNPNIRAIHAEQMFRGRPDPKIKEWQDKSWMRLALKYKKQSFAGLIPQWQPGKDGKEEEQAV